MAEVLLNNLSKGRFVAYSAGSFPVGVVNPDSIATLKAHNLTVAELTSKSWHELEHIDFDIVITVCDRAAAEACPLYLGEAIKAHWGMTDPDKVQGSKRQEAFEDTFTLLKNRIDSMLALPSINQQNLNIIPKSR